MALDEETKQLLNDLQEQIGDLTKANADERKAREDAEAAASKAQDDLEKVKKGKPLDSDSDDDENPILKGMSPAVRAEFEEMRKNREELRERIAKQEERSEIEDCEKKIAKRFPNIPVRAVHFAPIYRKISKVLQADELMSLDKLFASHSAAMGQLGEDLGRSGIGEYEGDGGADAYATIEARARDLRKLEPRLTKEQSIAKVIEQDPRLYEAYRKEVM